MMNPTRLSPEEFRRYYTIDQCTGCWIWYRPLQPQSRPLITAEGRQWTASRYSWLVHRGTELPEHLQACHTCDNYHCVNYLHLFPGTPKDNYRDFFLKYGHKRKRNQ